ncbi:MAG: endolytic transglycosylase MltG, partial [Bacteroidales bacterium]|nr:endolytic transglycosylase MltG [Bacteroidales bacterium]
LENGMSNERVLTILSLALQTPVNVVINPARDAYTIASRVGKQLEADSAALIAKYFDTAFIKSLGYDTTNAYCLIIPNTYEFYWTTDASQFWERMRTESDKFWKKREQKFDDVKLTKEEVVTLASIVERETQKNDEKKLIAGVYMNRLQKRMRLEADPTLVYIANQENIRRVLNRHKNIDSPYNTYKYAGLPPGPIWIPSVASIDAVLDYEDHEYLFFCAKDDFSGCHAFAKSYAQHKVNAKKFQKALNDRQIYK